MSAPGHPQGKSVKKYVLQQSNCNLDNEEPKQFDKALYPLKAKEEASPETENQCTPQKIPERTLKSDSKKLRSVRLDLSSHKRGVIQKGPTRGQDPEEESSDDEELKTKRKPPSRPVVPNYVTNSDSGPCRKPRHARQDQLLLSSQSSPRSSPQSLSIARRNARERNRVKQVNEGFATLRSRIPDYISEAYNEEKGRKSAKKLSKVETLRMAVDYIRHLETLLDLKSTEKDVWLKEIKMEEQSWDATPDPGEYQPACVESPGATYEQGFEYQERIFYDYDMEFVPRKKMAGFGSGTEAENQCVEDFKYYETFNRIRKEGGGTVNDDKMAAEGGEEEGEEGEEEEEDVENVEVPPRDSLARNVIMKKVAKKSTVLPSITESFNKSIPVFF